MKFLSKEEYLKLIESSQENDFDDEPLNYIIPEVWIPSESPAKEKMEKVLATASYGIIDVLKYRKEQIKDALYKCVNLQVGEFVIHIKKYNGKPNAKQLPGPLTLDITVLQEKYKTPSGSLCRMSYKMDFFQDKRFSGRPWLAYFDSTGFGINIPIETVVEIVRWMQSLRRLNAFL